MTWLFSNILLPLRLLGIVTSMIMPNDDELGKKSSLTCEHRQTRCMIGVNPRTALETQLLKAIPIPPQTGTRSCYSIFRYPV